MPHRTHSATPKVKDIKWPLDNTRPFMDDTGRLIGAVLALSAGVCARAPMLILVHDPKRWWVGDMMVMGCCSRWGKCGAAARSLRAVHAGVAAAGSRELAACIG